MMKKMNNTEKTRIEESDSQKVEFEKINLEDTKGIEIPSEPDENEVSNANGDIEETEIKKQKKKKLLTTIFFLLANILVVLIVILMEDKSGEMEPWRNVRHFYRKNWQYFVLAFSMFFVLIIGDSIVFYSLTKRMKIEKNAKMSIMVSVLGRYYDRITPMATGGEPFQMAFLRRSGMKTSDSCAVTMSRHIIRFFTTAAAVIGILIFSGITTDVWVMIVAILSVLGGLIVPVFMVICCFRPAIGKAIAKGIITLLYKLKLVKDYDKQLNKLSEGIENFLKGIEYLSANKKMVIVIGLVALIELFANNSIPYFIMKGFDINLQYWNVLVLCIFVNYASSLAPTPGGAGLAELSFYAIFQKYIGGGHIFWAVLTWRLAIFYVPIAIGFLTQLFESLTNLYKHKKQLDAKINNNKNTGML